MLLLGNDSTRPRIARDIFAGRQLTQWNIEQQATEAHSRAMSSITSAKHIRTMLTTLINGFKADINEIVYALLCSALPHGEEK